MEKLSLIISQMPKVFSEKNRIQSASSIKTLKQCPRKYYYKYVENLDEGTNIHAVRGKAAHSALEEFFKMDKEKIRIISLQHDKLSTLKAVIRNLFDKAWIESREELKKISLPETEIKKYHDETIMMLMDYVQYLYAQISNDLILGFEKIRPYKIEEEIVSQTLGVRGFIDVQHKEGQDIIILDYKTNSKMDMDEHIFQLAMYALLINEKHGIMPKKAGIIFLKFGGKTTITNLTHEMLNDTLYEIEQAHLHTQSSQKTDYPKKESALCKWRSGQCGFYNVCSKDCN